MSPYMLADKAREKREIDPFFRRAQEGCGGLRGENPAAFPKARPIFQQPFSFPDSAQTLAGIAFRAAGTSGKNFPAASKIAGKPLQQGISDSHGLLEFSDFWLSTLATWVSSEFAKTDMQGKWTALMLGQGSLRAFFCENNYFST